MTEDEQKLLFQQIVQLEIRYFLKELRLLVRKEIQAELQTTTKPLKNEDKILVALRTLFNGKQNGFASLKDISNCSGLCRSTVVGNINRLILKGRLTKNSDHTLDGGNLTNFFHILDDADAD